MKASVRNAFVPFTAPLEGVVRWMYLDVKGLVTTAIGNLIDPVETALDIPFVYSGTEIPAPQEAIRREWERVKAHPTAARQGHRVLDAETSLRLTDAGIQYVVQRRLSLNEMMLRQRFPEWDSWPADAQLATLSMAWACGAHFDGNHRGGFPLLGSLLRRGDFAGAVGQCHMNETGNPGLIPRNRANKALYRAAAAPKDPDLVSWDVLTAVSPQHFPARCVRHTDCRQTEGLGAACLADALDVVSLDAPIVRPRIDLVPPDRTNEDLE